MKIINTKHSKDSIVAESGHRTTATKCTLEAFTFKRVQWQLTAQPAPTRVLLPGIKNRIGYRSKLVFISVQSPLGFFNLPPQGKG